MLKSLAQILLFTASVVMLVSCGAQVPVIRVWQPWTRTMPANHTISKSAKMSTQVSGDTEPLLGQEQLLCGEIQNVLDNLLRRRGFELAEEEADFRVELTYSIVRRDMLEVSSAFYSENAQDIMFTTGSGAGVTAGLGVAIARAVGASSLRSVNTASQSAGQRVSFTHTFSLEIFAADGKPVWKGESTWDDSRPDLTSAFVPALQLILSDLPGNDAISPQVEKVKASHAVNFYKLCCEDRWFSCPALPYRIAFEKTTYFTREGLPDCISNTEAIAAYVDLINTAEYALPDGKKDFTDPANIDLWKKAILGQRYLLGTSKEPVNVLIRLSGKSDGYIINEASVVSNEEFSAFLGRFEEWKKALREYYDFYEN